MMLPEVFYRFITDEFIIVVTSMDHQKSEGTFKVFKNNEEIDTWRHDLSLKQFPGWHRVECNVCKSKNESLKDFLVTDLELSVRSHNVLELAGIKTLAELLTYDDARFLSLKNAGRKSLNEIKDVLYEKGLTLFNSEENKS